MESDHKPGSPLHEIARILSSRGIAATVDGDAVAVLLPRRRPTQGGGHHVVFLPCRIRSLAELGVLLGDDGAEIFWQEAIAEMEAAAGGAAAAPSVFRRVDSLLPPLGARSIVCGMAAFLFATAAYQDAIAVSPRAPVGTLAMALFALWQAYRQPAPATPSRVVAVPAKLCALAAAGLLLAMLMLLGHSIDGLIFGGVHQPVNSIVVFVFAVVLFVFVRNSEQRMDPEAWPPERAVMGFPVFRGEVVIAVGGFAWLVFLALMPRHPEAVPTEVPMAPAAQVNAAQPAERH